MSTFWIINQYATTPETGMGGRHHYLARALGKRGHKIYLVAGAWHHLLREGTAENLPETEDRDGYTLIRLPSLRYAHAHDRKRILNWFYFRFGLRKLPSMIADKPDAILFSSPGLIAYPSVEKLARRMRARLVFEVRDIWPLTLVELGGASESHPFIRYLQGIENRAYRTADAVVSNLPSAVDHMVDRGLRRDKFSWIPNGIALDEVTAPEQLSDATLSALPTDKFLIGYAGTLGAANAMGLIIDVAERLKENDSIAFVLVGSGKDKAKLRDEAAKRGLENVIFLDPIPKPQIQSLLARFDICMLSWPNSPLYRFGTSANKLFDYFYAARPVLNAFSGSGDFVMAYKAGLQVPAGDAAQFADALLQLQSMSDAERTTMGRNGRRAVLKNHDYTALAAQLESVLSPKTVDRAAR